MNEADTCRKCVVPKLQAAGWEAATRARGAGSSEKRETQGSVDPDPARFWQVAVRR